MTNDNLADLLIRIKNGYLARQKTVSAFASKSSKALTKILAENGYLEKAEIEDKKIVLTLKYPKKKPALTDLKKISKPGLRVYTGKKKLPRVLGGLGISIISTSQGLMTDAQAREKSLGGEVICKVW